MDIALTCALIALSGTLVNVIVSINNTRTIEKLKIRYSISENRVSRLQEALSEISQVRQPEDLDHFKLRMGAANLCNANQQQDWISAHSQMYAEAVNVYVKYRTCLSKTAREQIQEPIERMRQLESEIATLQRQYEQTAADHEKDALITMIIQKKSAIPDLAISGYRRIFHSIESAIEEIETKFI